MTPTPVPPDDDDRFQQFIADVGPMQQHPDDLAPVDVGRPVLVATAVLVGLSTVVAALGWAAMWLAIGLGLAITGGIIVLLVVGTALILIGGAVAFVGHHRRSP
jgi:hypothetical protein